jgi:hypothetical protein
VALFASECRRSAFAPISKKAWPIHFEEGMADSFAHLEAFLRVNQAELVEVGTLHALLDRQGFGFAASHCWQTLRMA